MDTWKETITKIVDMMTEDKLMAMVCLTTLGLYTIYRYPISDSLPVITGVISGIAGFVVGKKQ